MRPALAFAIVLGLTLATTSSSQPIAIVPTLGRPSAEPDGTDGRRPVDVTTGTTATKDQEGTVPTDALDYVREIAKQGTLGLLVIAILWSYRRDFFRTIETKDLEKAQLREVLEKSTAAVTGSAVATATQSDATHRLARAVENLEGRMSGRPPAATS